MNGLNIKPLVVSLLFVAFLTGCTSEEELQRQEAAKEAQETAARDRCIDNHVSRCKKACEVDPIKAYCGVVYPDNVIGSGCVQHLDWMARSEQIEACKARACDGEMLLSAFEAC